MSPVYYRVGPAFWADHPHWSDDQRLAALYLLTCRHRSMEGLFRLPLAYAADDLEWSRERFAEAFGQLLADGFVKYDEAAKVCLIVNALKWQRPANPNQVTAALNQLAELPKTPLLWEFAAVAETLAPALAERFRRRFGQSPTPTPTPTPAPDPSSPASAGDADGAGADPAVAADVADDTPPSEDVGETAPPPRSWPSEVVELCRLQSDLARARTEVPASSRRLMPTEAWHREMDRLIRLDGRSPKQVEYAIRWVDRHHFWSRNCLSVETLRRQFDRFAAEIRAEQRRPASTAPARPADAKAEARRARAAAAFGALAGAAPQPLTEHFIEGTATDDDE